MSRGDLWTSVESVHDVDAPNRTAPAGATVAKSGRDVRALLTGGGWRQEGDFWLDGVSRAYVGTRDAVVEQLRRNLQAQGEQVDQRVLETEADAAVASMQPLFG